MIFINLMVAAASLIFYAVLSSYYSLTGGVQWLLMLMVLVLTLCSEFVKIEMYKNNAPSFLSRLIGAGFVLFILGLSYPSFVTLWNSNTGTWDRAFLVFVVIVAGNLLYIPLSRISRLDKQIAKGIEKEFMEQQ